MSKNGIIVFVSPNQKDNPSTVPSPGPPSWVDALQGRVTDHLDGSFNRFNSNKNFDPSKVSDVEVNQYVKATLRYDSGTKSDLLDKVENKITPDAEWYKIMYHECLEPEQCTNSYSVERTGGTVPSYV